MTKKLIFIYLFTLSSFCFGQVNYKHFPKAELEQDLDYFSEKLTNIHPLFLNEDELNNWQNKLSVLKESLKDS